MKFSQTIPSYLSRYFTVLDEAVLELSVTETLATCSDCRMAKPEFAKAKAGSGAAYKAHLKCCTFWPELSNHQIGALLHKSEKHNVCLPNFLKNLDPQNCNPIGIQPSATYRQKFNQTKEQFGQLDDLLCPYYDRGANQCGIWAHRGGICTSYYCVSDKGERGLAFWGSLGQLQSHLEIQLAQYLLPFMGLSSRAIRSCIEGWLEPNSTPDFQEIWDELQLHPKEFYKTCYDHLQSLSDSPINTYEFAEIMGPEGQRLSQNFVKDLRLFKGN